LGFFRAFKDTRRFNKLDQKDRTIVFYAEDASSYVHFEAIINELTETHQESICYVTSSLEDPILHSNNNRIRSFYIGLGGIRTYFFLNLKADIMVMTMPDLESFHIKRSKAYPVHYVYLFHSIVSTHMIYRKGAFDHYDTIFCVGPHHEEEIRAAEKYYGLASKNLVQYGYGRLDSLCKHNDEGAQKNNKAEKNEDY